MIKPEDVSTPELAVHYADETKVGAAAYLGATTIFSTIAIHMDSGPESTSLGALSGIALYKSFDYLKQSINYSRRARKITEAEGY